MKPPTNQFVAMVSILLSCAMVFGAFWLSRYDHDLKLMSLQAVLTTGGTLLGIAGTLLVGVQAYKSLTGTDTPSDLPPGSSVSASTQSTVQIPPTTTTSAATTETVVPK
jgi:hypothetical protein